MVKARRNRPSVALEVAVPVQRAAKAVIGEGLNIHVEVLLAAPGRELTGQRHTFQQLRAGGANCGHWIQNEQGPKVNELLLGFLGRT